MEFVEQSLWKQSETPPKYLQHVKATQKKVKTTYAHSLEESGVSSNNQMKYGRGDAVAMYVH